LLRIAGGVTGWLWTACVVVAPVGWLFHPPFIKGVVVPMLEAVASLLELLR
jgi:hypothetical protein